MGCVQSPILAGTDLWDAFLVAGELDEPAEFVLRESLKHGPEVLDVWVRLGQPHLVHGVGLPRQTTPIYQKFSVFVSDIKMFRLMLHVDFFSANDDE